MKNKFLTIIMLLFIFCGKMMAQGTADLVVADAVATQGQTITVPVTMTGVASGIQFAIYPPEGVTIKKVTRGDVVKLMDDEDEYVFTFRTAERANGGKFVLCYSIGVPTTEAGVVANIVFEIGNEVAPGDYDILMKDAECAHSVYKLSTYSERTSKLTVSTATGIKGIEGDVVVDNAIIYNMAGLFVKKMSGSTTVNEIFKSLSSGIYMVKSNKGAFKVVK